MRAFVAARGGASARGRAAAGAVAAALLLAACTGEPAHDDEGLDPLVHAADARAAGPALAAPRDTVAMDLSHIFGELTGTIVVFDASADRLVRHNPERAGEGFLPASTFKIPNTLIALETGEATGPDFALSWDSVRAPRQPWWPAVWAQDHTLRTALPASVVWYYQELARRIGPQRMAQHLRRFDYGNADIGGGIDQFWLTGDLRISADEQVDFLRRLHADALGVSSRTWEIARPLLVLDETPHHTLSGKTGWAGIGIDGPEIGWLVGWLERDGLTHFYALNIEIRRNEDAAERMRIVRDVLTELGLLPAAEQGEAAGSVDRGGSRVT